VLSGLAVGAILGAPAAAAAAEPSAETAGIAAVSACAPAADELRTRPASIQEQFRASFTAGALTEPATDATTVICEG
jgi:hypothetical protein